MFRPDFGVGIRRGLDPESDDARNERDELIARLVSYERQIREFDDLLPAAEREIDRLNQRVAELKSRPSYRLVEPFRALRRIERSFRKRGFAANFRRLFRQPVTRRWPRHWRRYAGSDATLYGEWITLFERLDEADRGWIDRDVASWPDRPTVAAVIALASGFDESAKEALRSVLAQVYGLTEILVAVHQSDRNKLVKWLGDYAGSPIRPIVCDNSLVEAAMIARAFAAVSSDLCLFPGDVVTLSPAAVYLAVRAHRQSPVSAFIYPDEDDLDGNGPRRHPFFKPARIAEISLSIDVAGPATLFAFEKLAAIGGPSSGAGAAWHWDMVLRLMERFGADTGKHIPFVTVHRRPLRNELSVLTRSARSAVAAHLDRLGVAAKVDVAAGGRHLTLSYALPNPAPLVTVLIPTRDRVHLLRTCLAGLLHRTDYPALEVIVIDNGSEEPETLRYFTSLSADRRVRILKRPGPFNFSDLHNSVVPEVRGPLLAFLNNDIDVTRPDWLSTMVAHAVRPSIGAVGAKLLYPNGKVQHAGVVMGLSGGADHIFRGAWGGDPGPHQLLEVAQNVAVVTAACMVMRKDVYELVGGMDPAFPVQFNDVDLCLRIRQHGYEIVWTPEAELLHMESMSRTRGTEDHQSERAKGEVSLLLSRWQDWIAGDAYYNPNLAVNGPLRGLAFPPRVRLPWLA